MSREDWSISRNGDWGGDGQGEEKNGRKGKERGCVRIWCYGSMWWKKQARQLESGSGLSERVSQGLAPRCEQRCVRKYEDWIDWVSWFPNGLYWMGLVRS